MVDLVDRMRVEMYMQALNDYTIGEDGEEILSTQAHITRLSEGHRVAEKSRAWASLLYRTLLETTVASSIALL